MIKLKDDKKLINPGKNDTVLGVISFRGKITSWAAHGR